MGVSIKSQKTKDKEAFGPFRMKLLELGLEVAHDFIDGFNWGQVQHFVDFETGHPDPFVFPFEVFDETIWVDESAVAVKEMGTKSLTSVVLGLGLGVREG